MFSGVMIVPEIVAGGVGARVGSVHEGGTAVSFDSATKELSRGGGVTQHSGLLDG